MAEVKISELPSASSLTGSEVLPVVQGGSTLGATVNQIKDKIQASTLNVLKMNASSVQTLANIGELAFNPDTQTLEVKCSADVTLSIGQENYIRGKNAEADAILNGTVVYVSGGHGANSLIKRAGNADGTAERVIGVATQDIGANNIGFVTTSGIVNKLNTSSYAEGNLLWLGTNGAMTNVKPDTSVDQICIGVVLRSHANEGSILVAVKDDWRDKLAEVRSDLNKKLGAELISAADFSLSGYLHSSTGRLSVTETHTSTEKKWVSEGTIIEVRATGTSTVAILAVYSESESYIQAESIAGNNTLKTATFQVPSGGRYIAVSTTIADVNNSYAKISPLFQEKSTLHDDVLLELLNSDVEFKSLSCQTITTKNEVLFPCFVRNQSDLSTLDALYIDGYKRKLKYQAFKGLKLYGFDTTKKYMISHFWVDSYDEQHIYRIIIKQWDGSTWVSYFDTGNNYKTSLGVVDGKIFTWDKTIGTNRMIAQIDFSNLAINDGSTLNAGEPDLIIHPDCIIEQDLSKTSNVEFNTLKLGGQLVNPLSIQNISGVKPYFNSRRKPTFAFIWDDLNPTDALVFSVFQEYGFLPSFALISNNLNAGNAPEYQNYYMKGCTILAHSISHPSMSNPATITYEEVDNQMKTSKKIIESYGMRVSGWVTPQSSLHSDFFQLMIKNFGYGFTGLNVGLFNSTVDPLKMSRYGIESAMSNHNHTTIINRIDSAITNNELVVFYGHRLPSTYLNGDSTPYVTEDDLRFVLDYLKTKTDENLCQVLSADEAVYQYYKQPFI